MLQLQLEKAKKSSTAVCVEKDRLLLVGDRSAMPKETSVYLAKNYDVIFYEPGGGSYIDELCRMLEEDVDGMVFLGAASARYNKKIRAEIKEVNPWLPVSVVERFDEKSKKTGTEKAPGFAVNGKLVVGNKHSFVFPACHAKEPVVSSTGFLEMPLSPAIHRCLQKIHTSFHSATCLDRLSSASGVSKFYLCRLFKKVCGMTIKCYCRRLRIDAAKNLLCGQAYSIDDVQRLVGYKNKTHFYDNFKSQTGMTPLVYRRKVIKEETNHKRAGKFLR